MSDKSPRKSNEKKKGKTLQEKRTAKRIKHAASSDVAGRQNLTKSTPATPNGN